MHQSTIYWRYFEVTINLVVERCTELLIFCVVTYLYSVVDMQDRFDIRKITAVQTIGNEKQMQTRQKNRNSICMDSICATKSIGFHLFFSLIKESDWIET